MSVSTLSPAERTSTAAGYAGAVVTVLIWAIWVLATRHTASTSLTTIDVGLIRYGVPALLLAPIWLRIGLLPKGVPLRLIVMMVAGRRRAVLPGDGVRAAFDARRRRRHPARRLDAARNRADRHRPLRRTSGPDARARAAGHRRRRSRSCSARRILSGGMTPTGFLLLPLGGLLWAGYTHAFRRSGLTPLQGGALITGWSTVIHLVLAAIFGTTLAAAPLPELAIQFTSQGILSGLVATFAYGTAIRALGGTPGGRLHRDHAGAGHARRRACCSASRSASPEMIAAVVTGAGVALSTGILSKRA